jgi:gluconokinase
MEEKRLAIVVMGVAGCGKTSVATALASQIGGYLIEGDAFHPPANVAKMQAGIPLDDTDRAGWLDRLADELHRAYITHGRTVMTCSALKYRYRQRLREAVPALGFVFLDLPIDVAAQRVAQRSSHFMPASLVASQFAALESPTGEPLTLTVDAMLPLSDITRVAATWCETLDGESAVTDKKRAE